MSPYIIDYQLEDEAQWVLHGADLPGEQPMAVDDPFQALEVIGERAGRTLIFVGHEPLSHPELSQWLAAGKRLGLSEMGIRTDGRMLANDDFVQELVTSGLTMVDGLMLGSQRASHDSHTGLQGSFNETVAGLQRAIRKGLKVGLTIPVTRSNYRELADVVRWCVVNRIEAIHFCFTRAEDHSPAYFMRFVPRFEMVIPHLVRAARVARERKLPMMVSGVPFCIMGASAAACLELQQRGLRPRGGVTECHGCELSEVCPGLSAPYAERFGTGELGCSTIDLDRLKSRAQHMGVASQLFMALGDVEMGFDG